MKYKKKKHNAEQVCSDLQLIALAPFFSTTTILFLPQAQHQQLAFQEIPEKASLLLTSLF